MTDLFAFAYCESLSGAAHQPLNAASNLVFVALALLVWRDRSARLHRYGLLFVAASSILWHVLGHGWALVLDIGSIGLWVMLFCMDYNRLTGTPRCAGIGWPLAALAVCGLVGAAMSSWLPMLSGAFLPYVPLCLLMAFRLDRPRRGLWLFSAAAMGLAVVFRETDLALCEQVPHGTHWLWHLLTGLALVGPVFALRGLSRELASPGDTP